jgi:hypothetical protein
MDIKWLIKRGVVVAGIVYIIALVPSNIRPQWTASPFHKANQTITVPAESSAGTPPANIKDRLRDACKAAAVLRPVLGSAKSVEVIYTWNDRPVSVNDYKCALYV